jgi:hypothetical protein
MRAHAVENGNSSTGEIGRADSIAVRQRDVTAKRRQQPTPHWIGLDGSNRGVRDRLDEFT